ncbi:hypothetical protein [Pelagibacterium mangrovi]|uniref:hypothetical protein n=1 Tax=Pelagibacterium mangrovi TaxID=3119828 RepID=UPI002FC69E9B
MEMPLLDSGNKSRNDKLEFEATLSPHTNPVSQTARAWVLLSALLPNGIISPILCQKVNDDVA